MSCEKIDPRNYMWKKLVKILNEELKRDYKGIMLLRHSSSRVQYLKALGASVKEYTEVQAIDSEYDFAKEDLPIIKLVVVIINDRVDSIYEITGVLAQGTNQDLYSSSINEMHSGEGMAEVPARKFLLNPMESDIVGRRIKGWESKERTPVVRHDSSMFFEIEIETGEKKAFPVDSRTNVRSAQQYDFWKEFVEQTDDEEMISGPPSTSHYRWRKIDNLDLVISMNIAIDGIIIFIRAPKGGSPDFAKNLLLSREASLTELLGVPLETKSKWFFLDRIDGDYTDPEQRNSMAKWLTEKV
jgi:hypothetical protein